MKSVVVAVGELEPFFILAPERYVIRHRPDESGRLLSEIALIRRESVNPAKAIGNNFRVADTGDAEDGVLKLDRPPSDKLGSTKKRLAAGDVIISRLRPYLRQVAFVDQHLFSQESTVVGSTEFYVLCSIDQQPISFLVPWLLSSQVQIALAASLEGAHHPRFHDSALMQLRVPESLITNRAEVSDMVERAIGHYRMARKGLSEAIDIAERP